MLSRWKSISYLLVIKRVINRVAGLKQLSNHWRQSISIGRVRSGCASSSVITMEAVNLLVCNKVWNQSCSQTKATKQPRKTKHYPKSRQFGLCNRSCSSFIHLLFPYNFHLLIGSRIAQFCCVFTAMRKWFTYRAAFCVQPCVNGLELFSGQVLANFLDFINNSFKIYI